MKKIIILIAVALLAGCSSLPSMKYCDTVEYKRDGTRVTIHAECHAPVGGSSLPGATP